MEIIFSLHAIKRITERNINLSEITNCIISPDRIIEKNKTRIYFKLNKKEKNILILVCTMRGQKCKLITVIKTSKINKYL